MKIFLTFDDGPCPPNTDLILQTLAEYDAKATFFVCGKNVERSPQLAQKIVLDGHSIGNHSYSHSPLRTCMGLLRAEIERTQGIIQFTTGVLPILFRAPWGVTMPWLRFWINNKGLKIIHWDFHASDWAQPPAEHMAQKIIQKAFDGAVVLLHDGHNTDAATDRSQTIAAVKIVLYQLSQKGYEFAKL